MYGLSTAVCWEAAAAAAVLSLYLMLDQKSKACSCFNWAHFFCRWDTMQGPAYTASSLLINFELINYSLRFSELVIWFESARRAFTPSLLSAQQHPYALNAGNSTEAWTPQEGLLYMVCSSWIFRLVGNIDFKALSFSRVHSVFLLDHHHSSSIPRSAECVTVAASYYAPITFPSLYNPSWHKGKLFMICNYVL